MAKNRTETRKAELVETQNIALAITRLQGPPYDDGRWRRALYHAAGMTLNRSQCEKLRIALELP